MRNNFNYVILIITIIMFLTGGYRYYQYIIKQNYILEINTICDSNISNCFTSSEDLSFGQNPYEKVNIVERYAPKCLEEHNCNSFSCPLGLSSDLCEITYCSNDTKADGEECINKVITN